MAKSGRLSTDDSAGSLRLVRESLGLYRRLGEPWGIQRCLEQIAELAQNDGAMERAVRLSASAAALGEKHGIVDDPVIRGATGDHIAQARAVLGDALVHEIWTTQRTLPIDEVLDWALADDVGEPSPKASHSLSPRELEVLRHVVAGRSNQEIATTLFISPRTVESHVANILGKLNLDSRGAVAVYAVRHGIV
jgi:DNA-binding CsgD family transcriptional regulator